MLKVNINYCDEINKFMFICIIFAQKTPQKQQTKTYKKNIYFT